jgi:hypothetical protein
MNVCNFQNHNSEKFWQEMWVILTKEIVFEVVKWKQWIMGEDVGNGWNVVIGVEAVIIVFWLLGNDYLRNISSSRGNTVNINLCLAYNVVK